MPCVMHVWNFDSALKLSNFRDVGSYGALLLRARHCGAAKEIFQGGSEQAKLRYSGRNDRETGRLLELRSALWGLKPSL
jgi:hypothetical protein